MRINILGIAMAVAAGALSAQDPRPTTPAAATPGVRLESLAWPEAEPLLTEHTVVVLPVGAAAKEHGPHLRLRNDLTMAEYLTGRVVESSPVIVAPALTYHFYPAFLEYPGSTSLTLDTARALTVDVVRSLARYGPRRFYALNTGISTLRPLQAAAQALAAEGILLTFTDLEAAMQPAAARVQQQEGGTHADELETSMMLYIDPAAVDMKRAVKDYGPSGGTRLTRQQGTSGTYSPTGIRGDPTLATRDKGRLLIEALVSRILSDIEAVRRAVPPRPQAVTPPARPPAAAPAASSAGSPRACSPGDERTVRGLGDAYTTHWNNGDPQMLSELYASDADIIHSDGGIERTREVIFRNRLDTFRRREYRGSKHPMSLTMVRCVDADVVVADGKWEMRGVLDAAGNDLPAFEGQVTLVVKRVGGGWQIAAHRYTLKASAAKPPTFLKRPGWPKLP